MQAIQPAVLCSFQVFFKLQNDNGFYLSTFASNLFFKKNIMQLSGNSDISASKFSGLFFYLVQPHIFHLCF